MEWITQLLRQYPELAIFLTLSIGWWIGQKKLGSFNLGTVTSVLLVGVVVGQLNIPIEGPIKAAFFLLFLFAVGYSVGPQFFRGLKKEGLPQMGFAVIMLLFCLLVPYACARFMGYDMGQAAGLLAGSQTISAVIGVAGDTINNLPLSAAEKQKMIAFIPVGYAVTYLFGTAGSAWILAGLGPKLLGGIDYVKKACKELESSLGTNDNGDNLSIIPGARPIISRVFKATHQWLGEGKSVKEVEAWFEKKGERLFVERIRKGQAIIDKPSADVMVAIGDHLVLSGRRETFIADDESIGEEINDNDLLAFEAEVLPVLISNKTLRNQTLGQLRHQPMFHGVFIKSISRAGIEMPLLASTTLQTGDTVTIVGTPDDVERAAKEMGYADRPTHQSDMVFVGIGIFLGGIVGALSLTVKGIPISLSTSGGALLAGLVFGWLRSKHPTFGRIPEPALWVMNNVGLNLFIAIVGIGAGPSFVEGFKAVGWSLFIVGAVATTIPLIVGLLIGRYVFKFHPAINLGCNAGARTTTAALGAIQDAVESKTPALGYTVTYAVGNTLLIIWGVLIVLLLH